MKLKRNKMQENYSSSPPGFSERGGGRGHSKVLPDAKNKNSNVQSICHRAMQCSGSQQQKYSALWRITNESILGSSEKKGKNIKNGINCISFACECLSLAIKRTTKTNGT
jgi:hypothetical protein